MEIRIAGEVRRGESLSLHTYIRTGGEADYFVIPVDVDDLSTVMKTIKKNKLSHFVIGEGSNLLFSDEKFRGCVIKLGRDFEGMRISGERIYAGAALQLGKLVRASADNCLSGLECLYGIPGTVGGAASTNAGAYGTQLGNLVEKVTGVDKLGCPISFAKNQIEFRYRKAVYPEDIVITEVEFKLTRGSASRSLRIMEECLQKRTKTQPLSELTAGCIFKNPAPARPAGKLIGECGLKGRKVGDAMISSKHANFIVNKGNATTRQILSLINIVIDEVKSKTGIELKTEVEVVG